MQTITKIEIETNDNCNSRCVMCPGKSIYRTNAELDCKDVRWLAYGIKEAIEKGLICEEPFVIFSLHNEPLLDKDLFRKIEEFKLSIPKSTIHFYTNGLLVSKRLVDLIECDAIDEIIISDYGDNLELWNKTTGLNINEPTYYNMRNAIEILAAAQTVRIFPTYTNGKMFDYSTRAGLIGKVNIKEKVNACEWGRPYNYLTIKSNGDCILCCQDWKHETVYGNIKNNTITEVLLSCRYKDMMKKAEGKSESDLLFICKRCKFNSK